MSSHRIQTRKFIIIIGVDSPLRQVFTTVLTAKGRPASGFPAMSNFHATDKGVEEATANVEEFIQRSEPDRSLPQSVRDALVNDVHALEVGGDINYVRVHPAPDA